MNDSILLNEEQIGTLKEVVSIGANHSANALSQLTGKKTVIYVPEVKLVPLKRIVELVGPPERQTAVIYSKLMGDAQGRSLLIFSKQSAFNLVDILMKRSAGQTKFLSELDCSALKEVGNILTGAFVTSLAEFLNVSLIPSVPLMAYDAVGGILEALVVEFGADADYIYCIKTEFADTSLDIGGNFIQVFDRKSLNIIIEKINMRIKQMQIDKKKSE